MNPLQSLHGQGQAVWLDFLARRFIADGGLQKLVADDQLTGVTSNPSIFAKAITETAGYDAALKRAGARSDCEAMAPNTGVVLQITCDDAHDLTIPGQKYTFGIVKAAEARSDFDVLAECGRRLLRVHLSGDVEDGLTILDASIRQALE